MRKLSILRRSRITIASYFGEITLDEIINDIRRDLLERVDNKALRIIVDFTEARLLFTPHDFMPIKGIFKEFEDQIVDLRIAIILSSPVSTATMMIISESMSTSVIHCDIFSTRNAAIQWLQANS